MDKSLIFSQNKLFFCLKVPFFQFYPQKNILFLLFSFKLFLRVIHIKQLFLYDLVVLSLFFCDVLNNHVKIIHIEFSFLVDNLFFIHNLEIAGIFLYA